MSAEVDVPIFWGAPRNSDPTYFGPKVVHWYATTQAQRLQK